MASRINSMFDGINGFFGNESMENGYHQNQRNTNHQAAVHEQDEQDEDAAEREDLLDQHVAYYLKHHPEVHNKHNLTRLRPGVYNCNGREIFVEWHYAEEPGAQGYLLAVDGPLRQPFADYMQGSENGVQYDDKRLGKSSLSQIPKGNRMSFGDTNKVYSRLEAMKVAKEQALVREKAAEFSKVGMEVPQHELMNKYNKTISQKLGEKRQRAAPREQAPAELAASPVAAPVVALPPAAIGCPPEGSSPAATPNRDKPQTHGAPKYCANHDDSTKRKKCKPRNLPCSICQTLIQTNYVEFTICPTCSEKDHRCMCCGNAAVGAAPSPSPQSGNNQPAASPTSNVRGSPQSNSKQSPSAVASAMSPMNLFGMPDLFNADAKGTPVSQPQGGAGAIFNSYAATNPMAAASPQNVYSSQNAFASYNPMASQNAAASPQNIYSSIAAPQRRY